MRIYRPPRGRRRPRGLTRSVRTQRRSTAAAHRPTPERRNGRRLGLPFQSEESGWRDLNPRPFDPQSNALPNCATARAIQKCNGNRATTPSWRPQITHAKSTQNGTNKPARRTAACESSHRRRRGNSIDRTQVFILKTTAGDDQSVVSRLFQADRVGFEPTIRLPVYSISNAAPSTTRTPVLKIRESIAACAQTQPTLLEPPRADYAPLLNTA